MGEPSYASLALPDVVTAKAPPQTLLTTRTWTSHFPTGKRPPSPAWKPVRAHRPLHLSLHLAVHVSSYADTVQVGGC